MEKRNKPNKFIVLFISILLFLLFIPQAFALTTEVETLVDVFNTAYPSTSSGIGQWHNNSAATTGCSRTGTPPYQYWSGRTVDASCYLDGFNNTLTGIKEVKFELYVDGASRDGQVCLYENGTTRIGCLYWDSEALGTTALNSQTDFHTGFPINSRRNLTIELRPNSNQMRANYSGSSSGWVSTINGFQKVDNLTINYHHVGGGNDNARLYGLWFISNSSGSNVSGISQTLSLNSSNISQFSDIKYNLSNYYENYNKTLNCGAYINFYNDTNASVLHSLCRNESFIDNRFSFVWNDNETFVFESISPDNFQINFTVFVTGEWNGTGYTTLNDNFSIEVKSYAPAPTVLSAPPAIINMTQSDSYGINITNVFDSNYSVGLVNFRDPFDDSYESLLIGESFLSAGLVNVTWFSSNDLVVYSFLSNVTLPLNITGCNAENCTTVSTIYNITTNGTGMFFLKNFTDSAICEDDILTYNFSEYAFGFQNVTVTELFNSTVSESYTIISGFFGSFILSIERAHIPVLYNVTEDFFLRIGYAKNESTLTTETQFTGYNITFTDESGNQISQTFNTSITNCNYSAPSTALTGIMTTFLNGFIRSVADIFSGIFPDSDTLTSTERYSYVVVIMLIVTALIITIGAVSGNVIPALVVSAILDFLLFLFFVSIGYISIVFLVITGLLAIGVGFLFFRSRGG